MARCDICGSKECCGASLGPDIEKLERQRDQLLAALKEARRWLNGDSWRNGNLSERKCWGEFTTSIDETIAAVEGGNNYGNNHPE